MSFFVYVCLPLSLFISLPLLPCFPVSLSPTLPPWGSCSWALLTSLDCCVVEATRSVAEDHISLKQLCWLLGLFWQRLHSGRWVQRWFGRIGAAFWICYGHWWDSWLKVCLRLLGFNFEMFMWLLWFGLFLCWGHAFSILTLLINCAFRFIARPGLQAVAFWGGLLSVTFIRFF